MTARTFQRAIRHFVRFWRGDIVWAAWHRGEDDAEWASLGVHITRERLMERAQAAVEKKHPGRPVRLIVSEGDAL
jgi:hypothetical protein